MIRNRPYKLGYAAECAVAEILLNGGVQFHPGVARALARIAAKGKLCG
jgi:hypothetical protein